MQKEQEYEMKKRSELVNDQIDLMVRQQFQRNLFNENELTRLTQPVNAGKIMEGSSITNENYFEQKVTKYQKSDQEEGLQKEDKQQQELKYSQFEQRQYYVDSIIGQRLNYDQLREKQSQNQSDAFNKNTQQQSQKLPDTFNKNPYQQSQNQSDTSTEIHKYEQQKRPELEQPNQQQRNFDPCAIDFADNDDDDDEFDDDQNPKPQQFQYLQNPQGRNQYLQPQIKHGIDYNSDSEEQNLKEILQPDDEGEEIDQILITPENLPMINKYTKGTKFGKTTPITIKEFNTFEHVIQLFEDFIFKNKAYFLDFDDTGQEDPQEEIEELDNCIQTKFQEQTQRTNFGEQRNFFPFEDNQFLFYFIEKDPLIKQLIFYYDEQPEEDQKGEKFNQFLSIFQQLFQCEDYEVSQVLLPAQSKKKVDSFEPDGKYLKYMLTVFTIIYEQSTLQGDIIINDDTIARAFWALHQATELYTLLQENEEDVRNAFVEMLQMAQTNIKTVQIATIEEPYSEQGIENLQQQIQKIYKDFLSNKVVKQSFFSKDIIIQHEQKYCLYVHLQKVAQLNFLKV